MDPMYPEDDVLHTASRVDQARLLGFAALMLAAGWGLAAAAGPPRLPAGLPGWEGVLTLLAGTTLPLDGALLVFGQSQYLDDLGGK